MKDPWEGEPLSEQPHDLIILIEGRTKTNRERGERAYRYAHLYATEILGNEDMEAAITDLIADLAHLAEEFYCGGADALRLGAMHFTEEREEEE